MIIYDVRFPPERIIARNPATAGRTASGTPVLVERALPPYGSAL
jgi:hypothetical protein